MDNMGNFKGVMLCNRPAQPAPVPTAFDDSKRTNKAPFCSTVTGEDQLGSNPIKKEFPARKKKDESDDVTWRHKRWLAEFQERRNELAEMLEESQVLQEERTRKFQDKQAEMRATIRKCREENPGDRDAMKAALDELEAKEKMSKTKKMEKKEKLKAKPKWAMNEEENEAFEDLEVDDLLDFTGNLDFDQYMENLEVKESMDFVNDRLAELAEPKVRIENEEEGEGDEEEGEDRLTSLRDDGKKKKETEEDWENSSQLSTAESVASNILQSNKSMKGVHSQASVKAMLAQAQLAVAEPTIATNKDRNNATVGTSNLPYLFRSPQI
jgi:hypothetical protein